MADTGKLWFELNVRNKMLEALKDNQNAAKNLQASLKMTGSVGDRILQRLNMLRETKNSLDRTMAKAVKLGVDTSRLQEARREVELLMAKLQKLAENAGSGNFSHSAARSLLGADTAIQVKTVKEQIKGVTEEINKAEKASQKSDFFSIKNWRGLASAIYSVRQITRTIGDIMSTVFGPTVGFEKQLSNLAAILQTNIDGVKGLEDQALNLGRTTNYTASQVVELQTELSKLGYSEEQVRAATPGVLEFAQACGTDLASAATTAGSAIRAFGADASETKEYVATMAIATTHSALQFSDFQTIIGTVFPVAHQFNLTIQDTTALMMKLKDAGMNTSTAATSLRNIFLNLSNKDSKLSKLVGMDVHDMDSFVQAMQKMRDAAKTMGTEFLGISGEAAGKRGVTAFNVIAEQAKDLYRVRESITDVGDELDEMAGTQTRNAASAILRVKSAWEGWMLSIRESDGWLMNFLDNFASIINDVHSAFSSGKDIDNAFLNEVTNSVVNVEKYIDTLKDASSTEDERQKAAKKLADQLVETGICTADLIDKMKDQYDYYDFLISKENELTSTLRIQAAERVAIREEENAQTDFQISVDKNTKTYIRGIKQQTGVDLTLSEEIELENQIRASFQRMAKDREDFYKQGHHSAEEEADFRILQEKRVRDAAVEYLNSRNKNVKSEDLEGHWYGLVEKYTYLGIDRQNDALDDYLFKINSIEANLDGVKTAWKDTTKDLVELNKEVDTLQGHVEVWAERTKEPNLFPNAQEEYDKYKAQWEDAKSRLESVENDLRVKVTLETEQLSEELLATEKKIENWKKLLSQKGISIPIEIKRYEEAIKKLKETKAEADRTNTTVPIDVIVEAQKALAELNKVSFSLDELKGDGATLTIGVNDSAIAEASKRINNWLQQLSNTTIGIGEANIQIPFKPGVVPQGSIVKVQGNGNVDYKPTYTPKPQGRNSGSSNKNKSQRDAEAAAEKARNERIAKSNKEAARVLKVYQDEQKILKETKEAELAAEKARIDAMPEGINKDLAMKKYEEDKATFELWLKKEKAIYDQIMNEWDEWLEKKGGEKAGKADAPFMKFFKSDKKNLSDQADAVKKINAQVLANLNSASDTQSLINKTKSDAIIKKYRDKLDKELKGATPEFQIEVNEKTREEFLKQVEELFEDEEQRKKYRDLVNKFFDDKNTVIRLNEFKKKLNWEELFGDMNNLSFSALDMLEKQLEKIIETNKELDPQKMKEFVNQLNRIKQQKAILNPQGGLLGSYSAYRKARKNADDLGAEIGNNADVQAYLSALASGAENTKELGDVMVTLNGKTMKCSEALDELTKAQKNATDAQNNARANAKNIFGQENWITDMLEGQGADQSWQNFYSKILDGVAMNLESAGKLMDTLDLGDTTGGKAVKKVSGFASGINNAFKDFAKGDIFGALNDLVNGIYSLKDIFGEHGWAKQAEHLALSNEHLQKAIDNLADIMAKTAVTEKTEVYEKQMKMNQENIANMQKLLAGNASDSTAGFLGIKSKGSTNRYINEGLNAEDWARISNAVGQTVTSAGDLWALSPEQWKIIQNMPDIYTKIAEASDKGKTSIMDDLESYIALADKATELTDEYLEQMTGTTADALISSFAQGINSMEDQTKNFADNFTNVLRNAIINAFNDNYLERMKKWQEAFAKAMEDGTITDAEREDLWNNAEYGYKGTSEAYTERQKWLKENGYYNQSVSGMSASIQGVTEDTADLLASYINAIRADVSVNRENIAQIAGYVPEMNNTLAEGLMSLKAIEANTGRNADAAEEVVRLIEAVTTTSGQGRSLRVS